MTPKQLDIVIIGLAVTSSWGNGHATTYRALIEALARRGHRVTFLERDVPWYREHRDLTRPAGWDVKLYQGLQDVPRRFGPLVRGADLVIVGSYVPDGIAIAEWVTSHAEGIKAFYDIDTPVTLAGLDRGLAYISTAMIPRFDLYLSFTGGPIPGLIEDAYGSPMARPLYCSADPDLHRPRPAAPHWSLGYLGTFSEDRQPQLETLLVTPALQLAAERFVVAGSKYPVDLVWPANVERISHVAPHEHPDFYARQRFALNVTRADMRSLGFSPSVRLFEAAACGTPIISDHWPGIETILTPSVEILLAATPGEVIDILSNMPEEKRLSIAEQARRRILRDHTADHRAEQLEGYYLEAASRRARRPHNIAGRAIQAAETQLNG
ncbi:MAG: glycosyltransferase [Bradyrhizobium sp.]|uniref:CgeB family protein n=1 Tax=Bradyrhizobium sp. TaxID=376 RepID=UPI001D63E7CA|nr:glycosyltransferase [Bradyrhizobium sp.]MBV9561423.1 glycosyltransferase [Bradyrhizobium sp.]